jgi:hypothetical protein
VVTAQDAAGNVDVDFTETVTLTEASGGTLTNATQAAVSGVATFTTVTYSASADGEAFTLTANDEDGTGTDLSTGDANAVTSDVVATKLAFTTEPAGSVSGTALTTQPVVAAQDAQGVTDTAFTETVTISEASNGSLTNSTQVAVAGVATFSGTTYTATADQESFTLTANDEDGVDTNLTTATSASVTSDVVATKLVFTTEPAPLAADSGATLDFSTDPVVEAQDAADVTDTGYTDTVTLTETGDGTATFANESVAATAGVATFTGLTVAYVATAHGETFALSAADGSLTSATSADITASFNSDGTLTSAAGVTEPVALPSTATAAGSAVDIFDFTLTDGGGGDGQTLAVSQLVLNTSGTGPYAQVTFRLSDVAGSYDSGANTLTFSGLAISVADGGAEIYTVDAFYSDNTGLSEGQTFILTIDGDDDATVATSGTVMSGSNAAVDNGSGSTVDVTATLIAFTTQPSPLTTKSGTVLDFSTDPELTATDAAGNTDVDFTDTVTLTEVGDGTATYANNAVAATAGVATFTGLTVTYTAAAIGETFTLQADDEAGGDEGDLATVDTSSIATTADTDATLTAAGGVTEPIGLPSTADASGSAVDVFDFTLADGGGGDTQPTIVSAVVVHTSGDGPFSQVTFRLSGADATDVAGVYDSGTDTLTFSGLSISVADGASEIYTVDAFYADNASLTEDQTFVLSLDGDDDLTVSASGTVMSGANAAVSNGSGSTVDVDVTQLVVTTQPAGSVSGSALTTQPVVTAQDAVGNVDVDFTETITLTEASDGTLTNATQAAVLGVATFTTVTYTSTVDQEAFTLTADDDGGVGSDLGTVDTNSVTADVVATVLAFTTEPAGSVSGASLTTQPVVTAQDAQGLTDVAFTEVVTLTEASDGALANETQTATAGVATFTSLTYTATADQQAFTLTANDDDASDTDLPTADATATTSDVVATKLVFTTEPDPVTMESGATLDFTTDPVVEARDAVDVRDTDYTETVTLTETGDGTATFANESVAATAGVATFTGLTVSYVANAHNETFALEAGDGSLTAATSADITAAFNSDGSLTDAAGVTEPVGLPSTAVAAGSAVDVFDFTLADGGAGDTRSVDVSEIVLHTSGDGPFSQVTFRLNGADATDVTGTYDSGADTITFSSLSISVAEGTGEDYTVSAYYSDNTGLSEDQTLILTLDGDDDLTVSSAGTAMSGGNTSVSNGSGSTVDVAATLLAFTTQPAGSVSATTLTTQPVVTAQDAAGNTDVDFDETVTLSEASSGALDNATQTATSGVATFTDVTYTASADQEAFTLTADDDSSSGSDLASADANSLTSDVVATVLAFATEPDGSVSGIALTTQPVIEARDDLGTVDADFTETVTLTHASAGVLGSATQAAVDGVATFTTLEYTASTDQESFTLTANDEDASDSDLPSVDAGATTSDVVAVLLAFTTTPADGTVVDTTNDEVVSGRAFDTQPVVTARDADGTTDEDFNEDVTITSDTGSLAGTATVTAASGIADFSGSALTVSADDDGAEFTLTAANASGDLTTATTTGLSADAIATQLVFSTQPSPLSTQSNELSTFTTDPVVQALDDDGVLDTDFTDTVTLTEVGDGSATFSGGSVDAVAGVATFIGLGVNYLSSLDVGETFTLEADDTSSGGEGDITSLATSDAITSITNRAPTLDGWASSVTYDENALNAAADLIDSSVTFGDVDLRDFEDGTVTVVYSLGGDAADQLSIEDGGSGSGEIGYSAGGVTYSGVTIGSAPTSGTGSGLDGESLIVSLNASASAAAVGALLESLTYQNTSDAPAESRAISVTVYDGDAGNNTSDVQTTVIYVDAVNDVPTLSAISDPSAISEDASAQTVTLGNPRGWIRRVADAHRDRGIERHERDPTSNGHLRKPGRVGVSLVHARERRQRLRDDHRYRHGRRGHG